MIGEAQMTIFALVGGAAVIPFFARRLRVPSAALEICYGALLFNTVIGHRPEWFDLLSEIGFVYLMFLAGLELDLRGVRESGKGGWYLLVCLLSFTVTPFLFYIGGFSPYLGVAVAMISVGIVLPVLKEVDRSRTPLGRTIMGVSLTGELLSILVLTLVGALQSYGLSWEAALQLGKLALLFGLAKLVLRLLYLLAWWNPERVEKVMESEDPVEEGIRAVITIAFAGAILASMAGAEPILGSFLAGVIFTQVFRSKERFEEKVNAVGFGFLIPFFFMGVGAQLQLSLLASPSAIATALALTAMVLVSNIYPFLFARPLGLTAVEGAATAVLLSAPLSMLVVAGALGEKMGLLSPQLGGVMILTALLASVLYPSLFRILCRRLPRPESAQE